MTTPTETVINRLNKVRSLGNGRYLALCPVPEHDDRSPSLSITESDDGRVLLKCFAGCNTQEIVAAIGLEMKDLFHSSTLNPIEKRHYHHRKTIEEIECALWHELLVLLQFLQTRISDRQNWKDSRFRAQCPEFRPMPDNPWDRELLAVRRIRRGLEMRYGN
ncbi:MAG: hypothetical protein N0E58_19450 [Candidatus Thiodiazotropha endolucinida]|uniref:Zinc finger CHC2-type domain-containing protein n=1 Tax=Candidatus Thiodiazotropha taylori TaxID=2792791 RepID=A0A9E4TUX3_9GAMM|nr:hypothetical protein [Candidatus Thiodiazotropha taylori]MCW4238427.1 hypothetical protein [Candidatus Thiodiazotropha endolucinida]